MNVPPFSLDSITKGPDNALWFTVCPNDGTNQNAIGRIGTDGAVTQFAIGLSIVRPNSLNRIALGLDGNLWFTQQGKIGRITPTGTYTELPVPEANQGEPAAISDITAGSDGQMWFGQSNGGASIGRFTVSGTYSAFRLEAFSGGAQRIDLMATSGSPGIPTTSSAASPQPASSPIFRSALRQVLRLALPAARMGQSVHKKQ